MINIEKYGRQNIFINMHQTCQETTLSCNENEAIDLSDSLYLMHSQGNSISFGFVSTNPLALGTLYVCHNKGNMSFDLTNADLHFRD